jgi:hypothetical protein
MISLNGKAVLGFGLGDVPPSYVPPHPTSVVVKALAAGAVGAVAGAGISYADTRKVSASSLSTGATIGIIGALVATALK